MLAVDSTLPHLSILGDPGADSGGERKSKRAGKYGAKKSKERREELFWPFFTFLRAIFSRPFRLSLAPTICPWVSEDATLVKYEILIWDRMLS